MSKNNKYIVKSYPVNHYCPKCQLDYPTSMRNEHPVNSVFIGRTIGLNRILSDKTWKFCECKAYIRPHPEFTIDTSDLESLI